MKDNTEIVSRIVKLSTSIENLFIDIVNTRVDSRSKEAIHNRTQGVIKGFRDIDTLYSRISEE